MRVASLFAGGCGLLLDLDPDLSASVADAGGASVPPCSIASDGDLVALYRFDDSLAAATGAAPDGIEIAAVRRRSRRLWHGDLAPYTRGGRDGLRRRTGRRRVVVPFDRASL